MHTKAWSTTGPTKLSPYRLRGGLNPIVSVSLLLEVAKNYQHGGQHGTDASNTAR